MGAMIEEDWLRPARRGRRNEIAPILSMPILTDKRGG